jgi:hypothetical protein
VVLVADVAGMSAERIANWDWVGQADALAAASKPLQRTSEPSAAESYNLTIDKSRQHLERFRIELLLDEDNNVRRTRVAHVQSDGEDTWDAAWAGREDQQLLNFFVERARLRAEPIEPREPLTPAVEPAPLAIAVAEPIASSDDSIESEPPLTSPTEPLLAPLPAASLAGDLRLTALHMLPSASAEPRSILYREQPFDIRIALDFSDVIGPRDVPLNYAATVYTKNVRGGQRLLMGEARGTIVPADCIALTMQGTTPPPGIYRLEATVALTLAARETVAHSDLVTFVEGGLLQIY